MGRGRGTGSFIHGKADGRWMLRWGDDEEWLVAEGLLVDGKTDGRWVLRWASGSVSEGPYVDGERHGHWIFRNADGIIAEGPFVDGEMRGLEAVKAETGGCDGHVVKPSEHRLGDVALAALGDRSRWPEIARLNGITAGSPHRAGQCLRLPRR